MIPKRDIRYQAAIVQDGQVLLLRVVERDGSTFWLPPGGGREAGETEDACVRREVLEETGLTVAVERLLWSEPAPVNDPTYTRLNTYLCKPMGGSAAPGIEPEIDSAGQVTIQEVGWFDLYDPKGWPAKAVMGHITEAWLQRVQAALGAAG